MTKPKPKPKPTKRMAGPLPKKQVIGTPSSRTNGPAPMRDSTGRAPTGKSARFLPSGGALDSSPSRYNGKPNLKGIAYAPPSKQGARNKVSTKGNAAKQGMAAKAVVARATNQAQMNANFKAQLRETQAALSSSSGPTRVRRRASLRRSRACVIRSNRSRSNSVAGNR
jgi:hypothetical protein